MQSLGRYRLMLPKANAAENGAFIEEQTSFNMFNHGFWLMKPARNASRVLLSPQGSDLPQRGHWTLAGSEVVGPPAEHLAGERGGDLTETGHV